MHDALYGPAGFFLRNRPGDHFRTSALASPLFATALRRLLHRVDDALGHPDRLDLVDVGAGRGELLAAILQDLDPAVRRRVSATAVERAHFTPPDGVTYAATVPPGLTGLLIATEWLDNVPLDLARDSRYLDANLDLADPLDSADAAWCDRWWPTADPDGSATTDSDDRAATWPDGGIATRSDRDVDGGDGRFGSPDPDDLEVGHGTVVEIGSARDAAWSDAVRRLDRGLALAVDYGHTRTERPDFGTVTGFRDGREVPPALDGSTDITCHVAMDSVAEAGQAAAGGGPYVLLRQRAALHALGIRGDRPALALAGTDPQGYLRALVAAGQAGELTALGGLGGHWWLAQAVDPDGSLRGVLDELTAPTGPA